MKAVILAAGYGTRLQRDVSSDRSGRFAHLVGVPKPLLPVGRSPLISRWVRALTRSGTVDGIYVVTNALHQAAFAVWAAEFPEVQILSDETRSNEERLGAVACLQLAVKHFGIQDGVIVIGGDTLFREDFSLGRVAQKLVEGRTFCCSAETQKYGILEVDEDLRVLRMKEKPRPSETESRRACPCFYVFSKESLPLLDAFLEEKKDAPIEERDAPGNFVSWLIPRKPVFAQEISGRFDVGNLPSYLDCDVYFSETLQDDESKSEAVRHPVSSLLHLSDAFSHRSSILATREPNCMARLGRTAARPRPSCRAADRRRSFSPTPRGRERSAFSQTGSELRKLTTPSSRYGNLQGQTGRKQHKQGSGSDQNQFFAVLWLRLPGLLPVVSHHSVVPAQVPGGDPAQLHAQLLQQAPESRRLEPDSVAGVTGQLLVRSDPGQDHLPGGAETAKDQRNHIWIYNWPEKCPD
ncbi:hypothetical protein CCH79_00013797 [Gambusia affinis]|uniref:Nucleotidyl transferase domain-containing protein n=1 Tax=Gambusia affinis TaxID=33528 RepID=A0A315VSR0_GAMAF|nr:hypothetical protein CCH79_00013797 [Gambusia affinis]